MIKESDLAKLVIDAGFTYSPEKDGSYPMRNVSLDKVISLIADHLHSNGIQVIRQEKALGTGKRNYYLARASLARKAKDIATAEVYESLAGALPLGETE